MKSVLGRKQISGAGTLIETLGVVCAIAILLTVLLPSILRALDNAMLASTLQSVAHLRDAAEQYYKSYGKFAGVGGTTLTTWTNNTYDYWDRRVLVPESLVESALRSRLATNAFVRVARITTTSSNTAILSSGNLGKLGTFNGNNGLYNLTREYAALSLPPMEDRLLAGRRWSQTAGLAALSLSRPVQRLTLWLADRRSPSRKPSESFRVGDRQTVLGTPSGTRLFHQVKGFLINPLPFLPEACYPLPSGTPAPDTDIGYNVTLPNPMFSNPNAKTQIVAPSSTVPAYVVEVILQGVSVENAYRLSRAIDGVRQSNWAYFDSLGRVKYDMYDASGGAKAGVVFIYLAHK